MITRRKIGVLAKAAVSIISAGIMFLSNFVPADAAMTGDSVQEQIYTFMKTECGVTNDAAIAGLLGCIDINSSFNPKSTVQDMQSGTVMYGFGLWTGTRLNNLKTFCKNNKLDWQSTEGQLRFIKNEWDTVFPNVKRVMQGNPNDPAFKFEDSADGAYSFAVYLTLQYVKYTINDYAETSAKNTYYPMVKQFASAAPAQAPAANAAAPVPAQTQAPAANTAAHAPAQAQAPAANTAAPAPAQAQAPAQAPATNAAAPAPAQAQAPATNTAAPAQTQAPAANADAGTEQQVYNFLKQNMGINNNAAIAGVMANIEQDSNFDPKAHITDSYGDRYGLCLWYGTRLENLQTYCKHYNLDWQSTDGQLKFMAYEWNTYFKNVNKVFHNTTSSQDYNFADDASGANQFGAFFAIQYVRHEDNLLSCSRGDRAKDYTYQRVLSTFAGK